jgi:hypothetical protein
MKYQAIASPTVPALLQACRDAREIALKTYKLHFAGRLSKPVYFDPTKDSLIMKTEEALESFMRGHNHAITSVELLLQYSNIGRAPALFPQRNVYNLRSVVIPRPTSRTVHLTNSLCDLETVTLERHDGHRHHPHISDNHLKRSIVGQWRFYNFLFCAFKEGMDPMALKDPAVSFVDTSVLKETIAQAEKEAALRDRSSWNGSV